jgi:hypothetical protein
MDDSFNQWDIQWVAFVEVLVGISVKVECLKTLEGFEPLRAEVERALRLWTFKQAIMDSNQMRISDIWNSFYATRVVVHKQRR